MLRTEQVPGHPQHPKAMRTFRIQRENSNTNPQRQSVGRDHSRKSWGGDLRGTTESCQSQKQKEAVVMVDTEQERQNHETQLIHGQGAEGMPRAHRSWDQTVVRTHSGEANCIPQTSDLQAEGTGGVLSRAMW